MCNAMQYYYYYYYYYYCRHGPLYVQIMALKAVPTKTLARLTALDAYCQLKLTSPRNGWLFNLAKVLGTWHLLDLQSTAGQTTLLLQKMSKPSPCNFANSCPSLTRSLIVQ